MKKGRLIWGLLFLLAAAALIIFAIFPDFSLGISPWRLIVGILLAVWAIDDFFFNHRIADRLDCVLPLALLYTLFRGQIAGWLGIAEEKMLSSWIVICASVLLMIGFHILLGNAGAKKKKANAATEKSECNENTLRSSVTYLDASDGKRQEIRNRFGSMEVYYQNTEVGNTAQPLYLTVDNHFGCVVIHLPANCRAVSNVRCKCGDVKLPESSDAESRILYLDGEVKFGNVEIMRN